jgi:lipopolysaccharide export system ATP-binding protein
MSDPTDDKPPSAPDSLGEGWLIRPQVPANENTPEPLSPPAYEVPADTGLSYEQMAQEEEYAPAPAAVVVELPKPVPPEPRKPILVSKDSGLVVKNLGKHYAKRPVVRNVSISLQRGEAVGLLGPNGAGKTTCFYMITGLVSPDYGSIYMDGTDITNLPMYRRARLGIGYLPQEASIFRGLTVEQNIMAVLEVSEPDPAKRRAQCDELLAEFSITHLRNSPAIALSGGERRRAEIARSLAGRPNFVLLDEPLAGIDPIAIADVRDLVKHLKDRGIGVLITDHNVRETLDVIDRAYIIHDGTVLMEGSPSDIVNNHEVRRVYLGERFSL